MILYYKSTVRSSKFSSRLCTVVTYFLKTLLDSDDDHPMHLLLLLIFISCWWKIDWWTKFGKLLGRHFFYFKGFPLSPPSSTDEDEVLRKLIYKEPLALMSAASRKSSSGVWEFITTMLQNDNQDDDVDDHRYKMSQFSLAHRNKGQPSFILLATFLMLLNHHLSSSKKGRKGLSKRIKGRRHCSKSWLTLQHE